MDTRASRRGIVLTHKRIQQRAFGPAVMKRGREMIQLCTSSWSNVSIDFLLIITACLFYYLIYHQSHRFWVYRLSLFDANFCLSDK